MLLQSVIKYDTLSEGGIPMEKCYETITLGAMAERDFQIRDIFAMRQKWVNGAHFVRKLPRPTMALLFLNGCNGIYRIPDADDLVTPMGSFVCLPAGCRYVCVNKECGYASPDAYMIEFNLMDGDKTLTFGNNPFIIENIDAHQVCSIMNKMVCAYEAPIRSPLVLKSILSELLILISRENYDIRKHKYQSIYKGISLLEENAQCELTVEEIADICHVSSNCFRRLFREYMGKSPVEYRLDLKTDHVKSLLRDGMQVEEIAEALNFSSTQYLCKFFKKRTGLTPKEYRFSVNK